MFKIKPTLLKLSSLHLDILIVPYNLEEEKTLVIVMCFVFKRQFVQENT